MWTYAVLATALLSCIDAGDDIYVTSSSCGRDTSFPWTNEATLKYSGGFLSSKACTFSFEKDDSDWDKEICVEAEEFSLPCGVKVKYNGGYYPTYQGYHTAEKEFTCDNTQVFRWCSSAGKVYIGFEDTERGQIGSVELKITVKSNSDAAEFVASAVTSVAVIIGVVFGLIVLVVIVVIVIVCCVCNKRRSTGGTVYRAPQQAVATTGQSYPANANYPQQQAGYQPPPQGYQPQGYQPQGNQPPQQGYQPPPQGYQPPPQGYQQPPAQGYAVGYQAYPPQAYGAGYQPPPGYPGNPSVMTEKPVASAPPADMAPPPYPGN